MYDCRGMKSLCLWSEILFERSFVVLFSMGFLMWFNVHWMGR